MKRPDLFAWFLIGLAVLAGRAWALPQVSVTALTPVSPSVLLVGMPVQVSFDYTAGDSNPRIVAIPYTQGAPSPADSTHTEVLPSGSGTGTCTFTILDGLVNVDALHLEMRSESDSLLFSTVLPVMYAYNEKGAVFDIAFDPPSAGWIVDLGDSIHVGFDYTSPEDVRIYFQPYVGYAAAPSSAYGPSETLPGGSGAGHAYFTLTSEPAIVDQMRVQMWRANMTVLLAEAYLPVSYLFGAPTAKDPVTWGRLKAKRW